MEKELKVVGTGYQPWGDPAELLNQSELVDQAVTGTTTAFKETAATVRGEKKQLAACVELFDAKENSLGKFWVDGTLVSEEGRQDTFGFAQFSADLVNQKLTNVKEIK